MRRNSRTWVLGTVGVLWLLVAHDGFAHTASKVWMELRANGRFRVWVTYTVPELKERREAFAEFSKKSDADAAFFDLVRGADFYQGDITKRQFLNAKPPGPVPW